MDQLWKHCAKWKKPVTKGHMLYNFIYMKYPEEANLRKWKVDQWLSRAWGDEGWRKWRMTANGYVFFNDKNVLKLTVMILAQFCEHTKSHWVIHCKEWTIWSVNYSSIKLLLLKKKPSEMRYLFTVLCCCMNVADISIQCIWRFTCISYSCLWSLYF
jgi:hypothetical protein